ncbi:hypothetical protein CSC64_06820 [Pseudoxanthomonas koreensis]|nr:hypothetical protein CSC64_06820 [Pseudoxanthomonas koreensis]
MTAAELMASIRYQVFRPEVTTMGACPRCGNGSRGAGTCADCLGRELDVLTDGAAGSGLVAASRALRVAQDRVRLLVDGGEDGRG